VYYNLKEGYMEKFTYGHLLKVTRIRYGFDQREFSRILGISQATFSRYEKGKAEPPLSLLIRLTEEFNFPAYLLFYPSLDEFILNFPLDLLKFHIVENYYDYKPLRVKSNKRRQEDMIEILSDLMSTVGQVKQRYNRYTLQTFLKFLRNDYDLEKIKKIVNPIFSAYNHE
jgi:transcriptional regulator with XRE-family HTH domain